MEEGLLLKLKRYWKPLTFVGVGALLVVVSLPLANSIVSKGYNVGDVLSELDSEGYSIKHDTVDEANHGEGSDTVQMDIASDYDDVNPDAISVTSEGIQIYGYSQDDWDRYHEDYANKIHMMGQYYESQLYNIQNDDPVELAVEKTKYILSTELSPYLDVLDDGEYRVEKGKDKYGFDLFIVTFSFPDGVELSFEYKKTVSPTHIVKNKEFDDEEKEYFRWITEPETGMVNIIEDNGKWSIGR